LDARSSTRARSSVTSTGLRSDHVGNDTVRKTFGRRRLSPDDLGFGDPAPLVTTKPTSAARKAAATAAGDFDLETVSPNGIVALVIQSVAGSHAYAPSVVKRTLLLNWRGTDNRKRGSSTAATTSDRLAWFRRRLRYRHAITSIVLR
jgi:hypothetical protein